MQVAWSSGDSDLPPLSHRFQRSVILSPAKIQLFPELSVGIHVIAMIIMHSQFRFDELLPRSFRVTAFLFGGILLHDEMSNGVSSMKWEWVVSFPLGCIISIRLYHFRYDYIISVMTVSFPL